MRYLPHTSSEIEAMLQAVDVESLDQLFRSIPEPMRDKAMGIELPASLDEISLNRHVRALAGSNRAGDMVSFLGAGAYDHWFPQAADQLLMRSEFYTAYTPYQAEVAQGTLQVIFEFQTIVSEILGLPVANASMYDASTGLAEAVLMARRLRKRDRTVVSAGVHPQYIETIDTLIREIDGGEANMTTLPVTERLTTDVDALIAALDETTACVVVGYPNFFGTLTDLRHLADKVHQAGAMLITLTPDPFALALAESPGALGADIAVAEGQALGLPPQYGGPGVGLFATHNDRKSLQQLPGRLCGQTVDDKGERGFVLTLSTREQHIRRDRATSNICTNSGLCATALTIKMCLLGKSGFVEAAEQCLAKTAYLRERLAEVDGLRIATDAPIFNELPVTIVGGVTAAELVAEVAENDGLLAGVDLAPYGRPHMFLAAVTEKHRREDLDRLVDACARALKR
ncbi:MAG: aminomethyl-transferring glycine dehydrogenase subunit GcvPA [Myxococcota bacterium]